MISVVTPDFSVVDAQTDWLLINKAAGIGMHSEEGMPGIVERVREALGDRDLFPVHRLDRMTSGLLLLGRSREATGVLSRAFAERTVEKYYLALSDRKPLRKQGWVIGDMAQARQGSWKLMRTQDQPAVTRFVSLGMTDGLRVFLLRPYTGKTHQLRVALRSLGAPVLGDPRYYSGAQRVMDAGGESARRGYLHAWALCFPWQGSQLCYRVSPKDGLFAREDVRACVDGWGDPWSLTWPAPPGRG